MRYRIPANEADFERLCLALLQVHWDCPSLDLYAHRGEKQFGVDILDLGAKQPLSAAQCKLHEEWKTISPAEIRREVQKASEFRPKLGRYGILTTAKASHAAHDAVLKINEEHRERGLFQVELITWGKIENLLDRYEQVGQDFYATIGGQTAAEISEKLSDIHKAVVSEPSRGSAQQQAPAPIPKADPHRFAVALTHLTHDDGQELEHLIVESIRGLEGVQVLRFDRTISAEGPIPEESEREAHDVARALLRESCADVLIWGTALSHGGRTAPRLYWTTAESSMRSRQPYLPEKFRLPELFWEDLVEVLRLLVVTRSAELFAARGRHIAAELAPFVSKVRNLLESGQASERWTPGATAQVMFILAMALEQLGEQTGRRDHLTQSVKYYREILSKWPLDENPAYWAVVQNNLAVALGALGILEPNSSHLLEAVDILSDLLKRWVSRDQLPMVWACAQNNLGNALVTQGERESGTEKLQEAAEAYRAALNEWTRERFPLDWAALQSNLGYALQVAGSRHDRNDFLLAAIAADRSALEEWPRDEVPMYWAQAQNNLGNALMRLGERQPDIELLEEAAGAYRLALEERVFEREPLAWGEAQSNLGGVLTEIADRTGDPKGLSEAVEALRQSLKVRTREAVPLGFASSKNNLGHALVRLGEYENDVRHFEEAIGALRDALQVWTRESVPSRWSVAQHNLGDALVNLGKRQESLVRLDEAKAAYNQALAERHRDREPSLWAGTQAALGSVYYIQGQMESGIESLEVAICHYKSALEEYRAAIVPFAQAGAQFNLGNVLRLLGQRNKDTALLCQALENHAAACQVSLPYSPYWAFRAAEAGEEDMAVLKGALDPLSYETVLAKHGWISKLRSKHAGHQIGLMPAFRAIVAGKSGNAKPDFSFAPRRGDKIKDGSVVWENAGKFSYCLQCKEFLAAPNNAV